MEGTTGLHVPSESVPTYPRSLVSTVGSSGDVMLIVHTKVGFYGVDDTSTSPQCTGSAIHGKGRQEVTCKGSSTERPLPTRRHGTTGHPWGRVTPRGAPLSTFPRPSRVRVGKGHYALDGSSRLTERTPMSRDRFDPDCTSRGVNVPRLLLNGPDETLPTGQPILWSKRSVKYSRVCPVSQFTSETEKKKDPLKT